MHVTPALFEVSRGVLDSLSIVTYTASLLYGTLTLALLHRPAVRLRNDTYVLCRMLISYGRAQCYANSVPDVQACNATDANTTYTTSYADDLY